MVEGAHRWRSCDTIGAPVLSGFVNIIRGERCSGHPNSSAHVYVPKGIESPWDHHSDSDFVSVSPPGFRNIRKFLEPGTRLLPHSPSAIESTGADLQCRGARCTFEHIV